MVTTTRALPLSSQSRLQHSTNNEHTTRRRGRGQPPSATYMSSLTHEIDGSERQDNPTRVKSTRRVIPRLTYKASSACAGMLWCDELVRVRTRAIAFTILRQLCRKKISKFGFRYKGCRFDSARLVLRPENTKTWYHIHHLRVRTRDYIRDGPPHTRTLNVRFNSSCRRNAGVELLIQLDIRSP